MKLPLELGAMSGDGSVWTAEFLPLGVRAMSGNDPHGPRNSCRSTCAR